MMSLLEIRIYSKLVWRNKNNELNTVSPRSSFTKQIDKNLRKLKRPREGFGSHTLRTSLEYQQEENKTIFEQQKWLSFKTSQLKLNGFILSARAWSPHVKNTHDQGYLGLRILTVEDQGIVLARYKPVCVKVDDNVVQDKKEENQS
jgi:hypothetical protein